LNTSHSKWLCILTPITFITYDKQTHLTTILIITNMTVSTLVKSHWSHLMYVCLCRGVTDHQIRTAIAEGADLQGIRDQLGVMTQCGKCAPITKEIARNCQGGSQNSVQLWSAV
jgi:bacterioferritin-associated ferredoxin